MSPVTFILSVCDERIAGSVFVRVAVMKRLKLFCSAAKRKMVRMP